MSNEQDTLALLLANAQRKRWKAAPLTAPNQVSAGALDDAAAVLAAGYRKPRTISTAKELAELTTGAILLDFDGDVVVADPGPEDMWFRQVDETWALSASAVALPATVLYEPGAAS